MIHREQGKKWDLPDMVVWGGPYFSPTNWEYEVLGFRPPRKGELYLSGAPIEVYDAPHDLGDSYLVINLLRKMVQETRWVAVAEEES